MTNTYNTIPTAAEATPLAPKKIYPRKGLVAGAAVASFILGMLAVTAAHARPAGAAQAMLKGDPGCNDENAHADSSKLSEKLNKAMKGDGFIFIDDTGNGKYQKETFVQSFKFASGRCINCTLWFCH